MWKLWPSHVGEKWLTDSAEHLDQSITVWVTSGHTLCTMRQRNISVLPFFKTDSRLLSAGEGCTGLAMRTPENQGYIKHCHITVNATAIFPDIWKTQLQMSAKVCTPNPQIVFERKNRKHWPIFTLLLLQTSKWNVCVYPRTNTKQKSPEQFFVKELKARIKSRVMALSISRADLKKAAEDIWLVLTNLSRINVQKYAIQNAVKKTMLFFVTCDNEMNRTH